MAHCINLSHPDFIKMASQVDIPAIELAARIGIWQDENDTYDFPKLEDIEFEKVIPIDKESIIKDFEEVSKLLSEVFVSKIILNNDLKTDYRINGNIIELRKDALYKNTSLLITNIIKKEILTNDKYKEFIGIEKDLDKIIFKTLENKITTADLEKYNSNFFQKLFELLDDVLKKILNYINPNYSIKNQIYSKKKLLGLNLSDFINTLYFNKIQLSPSVDVVGHNDYDDYDDYYYYTSIPDFLAKDIYDMIDLNQKDDVDLNQKNDVDLHKYYYNKLLQELKELDISDVELQSVIVKIKDGTEHVIFKNYQNYQNEHNSNVKDSTIKTLGIIGKFKENNLKIVHNLGSYTSRSKEEILKFWDSLNNDKIDVLSATVIKKGRRLHKYRVKGTSNITFKDNAEIISYFPNDSYTERVGINKLTYKYSYEVFNINEAIEIEKNTEDGHHAELLIKFQPQFIDTYEIIDKYIPDYVIEMQKKYGFLVKRFEINNKQKLELKETIDSFEVTEPVYNQTKNTNIIGQANIKARTVLVDAINQKQDTLPHEYAHHYIAWFRDTPIVQEAIKKWGSEEALVQSIGEQVVKQEGEAFNWWNTFVKWILDKFNSLSKLDKQEVTQILTDAFLTRQDLNNTEQYKNTRVNNTVEQIEANRKKEIADFVTNRKQPDVILPIGTSGSGKSTFIKSINKDNKYTVIEPDAMRVEFTGDMNDKSKDKEIYAEAANRAIKSIQQGKPVIFDTTNLTKDKRLPFIEAIKKVIPNANIQYKLMELNPELAKQRIKAQLERGENRAAVSDATIDRHAESYKQALEDIKNEPITNFDLTDREFIELERKQAIEAFVTTILPTTQVKEVVYHGSSFKIDKFEIKKEPLVHFGTKQAANRKKEIVYAKGEIDYNDLVDDNYNINWDLFEKITDDFFAKEGTQWNLKNRPEKHSGEKVTIEHIKNVVETAKTIEIPNSVNRKDLVIAALLHDIGKPYRREDHGKDGIEVMDKLFKNNKSYNTIRLAVKHHMNLWKDEDMQKVVKDVIEEGLDKNNFIDLLLALGNSDVIRNRKLEDIDDYTGKSIKESVQEQNIRNRNKYNSLINPTKETIEQQRKKEIADFVTNKFEINNKDLKLEGTGIDKNDKILLNDGEIGWYKVSRYSNDISIELEIYEKYRGKGLQIDVYKTILNNNPQYKGIISDETRTIATEKNYQKMLKENVAKYLSEHNKYYIKNNKPLTEQELKQLDEINAKYDRQLETLIQNNITVEKKKQQSITKPLSKLQQIQNKYDLLDENNKYKLYPVAEVNKVTDIINKINEENSNYRATKVNIKQNNQKFVTIKLVDKTVKQPDSKAKLLDVNLVNYPTKQNDNLEKFLLTSNSDLKEKIAIKYFRYLEDPNVYKEYTTGNFNTDLKLMQRINKQFDSTVVVYNYERELIEFVDDIKDVENEYEVQEYTSLVSDEQFESFKNTVEEIEERKKQTKQEKRKKRSKSTTPVLDAALEESLTDEEQKQKEKFVGTINELVKRRNLLIGKSKKEKDFETKKDISIKIQKLDADIKTLFDDKTLKTLLKIANSELAFVDDNLKKIQELISSDNSLSSETVLDLLNDVSDYKHFTSLWTNLIRDYEELKQDGLVKIGYFIEGKASNLEISLLDTMKTLFLKYANSVSYSNTFDAKLFEPLADDSWFRSRLLSGDFSTNELITITEDILKHAQFKARERSQELITNVENKWKETEEKTGLDSKAINELMLQKEIIDGVKKHTGNFVNTYNQEYYKIKEKLIEEAKAFDYSGSIVEKVKSKKAWKKYYDWLKENSYAITLKELKFLSEHLEDEEFPESKFSNNVLQAQKNKLKRYEEDRKAFIELLGFYKSVEEGDEYEIQDKALIIKDWEEENSPFIYLQNDENNITTEKNNGAKKYLIYRKPKEQWQDPDYVELQKNPEVFELYNLIMDTIHNNNKEIPYDYDEIPRNYLPELTKSAIENITEKGITEFFLKGGLSEEIKDSLKGQLESTIENRIKIKGKTYKQIPVYMMENRLTVDEKSLDILKVLKAQTSMASTYKYMHEIQVVAESAKEFMENMEEAESTGTAGIFRKNIFNKVDTSVNKLKNSKDHLEYILDVYLYNERKAKSKNSIKIYNSEDRAKLAALNLLDDNKEGQEDEKKARVRVVIRDAKFKAKQRLDKGDITQEEYDNIIRVIDRIGSDLTMEVVGDAVIRYTYLSALGFPNFISPAVNGFFGILSNIMYATAGTEYTANDLFRALPIIMKSWISKKTSKGNIVDEDFKKIYLFASKLALLGDVSEGVSNGNWLDKLTFLQEQTEKFNQMQVMVAVLLNKKLTYGDKQVSIWDAYKIEDNKLVFDSENYGTQDEYMASNIINGTGVNFFRLERLLDSTVATIHGDYKNPLLAKKDVLGRVLMLFRTWLPMAIMERFGVEQKHAGFGRIYKGRYRSISSAKTKDGLELTFREFLQTIGNSIVGKKDGFDFKDLSEIDQQNLRKVGAELTIIATLILLHKLLQALFDDLDDDDRKYLNYLSNFTSRTISDFTFFINPQSAWKVLDNAVPIYKTVTNLFSIIGVGIDGLQGEFYYEKGPLAGQLKIGRYFMINVPGLSAANKMINYGKQEYDFYGF